MPRLERGETVRHAYLGLSTLADNALGASGAQVENVVPGGPADKAGLQQGDVITKVGSTQVVDSSDVSAAIAGRQPGEEIAMQVERGGATVTLHVKLGNQPKTP